LNTILTQCQNENETQAINTIAAKRLEPMPAILFTGKVFRRPPRILVDTADAVIKRGMPS